MKGTLTLNGKDFPIGEGDHWFRINGKEFAITEKVAHEIKEWMDSGHSMHRPASYIECPTCGARYYDDDYIYCPQDAAKLPQMTHPEPYEVDEHGRRVD